MQDRLCLLVCQNLVAEAAAVVESRGFDDVRVLDFPAECGRPGSGWQALEGIIRVHEDDCSRIQVLGGCCLAWPDDAIEDRDHCHIHRVGVCFELFCSKSLIEGYVKEGAYLLSPGWLARWRQHVDEWGFDRETAREFFAESCTRLLLLDTGIDERSSEHLTSFAEFVGRPSEIRPIGLGFFQLLLSEIILNWRSENEITRLDGALTDAHRQVADYAMVLDLMSSLTEAMTEAEVIEGILELFVMFCAPASLVYVPWVDGQPGDPRCYPPTPAIDEALLQRMGKLQKDYAWTGSGDGFLLRLTHRGEVVAVLALDGLAFPEYKNHYLNLALNVENLCGLAIVNARTYQEIRQAHDSLREQTLELQVRTEELDAFAHTVAHDLQNPLALMVGFAEFLEESHSLMPAEAMEEYLQTIARGGRKMMNIVHELLLLASVRKADVEMEPLDLEAITAEARERLGDMIGESQAEIEVPATWPLAWGHASWVEEVWVNYLSNAIKYGGQPPRIVLGADPQADGMVRCWVRDYGSGLAPEEQARLFLPFTKLGQIRAEGHGLGLSIVQRIVEKLGGQVGVESEGVPGRGSVFSFTLPGAARPATAASDPDTL